ncbi:MAG: GTPase HflX [Bacilli bacterium]|nr:GTPase HflX [Bacilli bacterium]
MSFIETEQVVIVAVNTNDDEMFYYQLTELKSLCEACNFEVIETITQNLNKPISQTYVGSGKLEEIKNIVDALNVNKIIFNDELTPSQIKNINDALNNEYEIIDRTMLILEIFEKRATTKEASLQVEVAKLKYMLPRLIGTRSYMSRTTGGGGGGAGARRGLGETKLELDRRHIEMKISKAKEELENIKFSRATSRKMRNANGVKTVAFVGYTNAGKSSTINSLIKLYGHENDDKEVFVKDMLFATLETQTRKIKLPNNHQFLITDTVGFVSKLPHHLVESFKSTLEEILEADLIIHIVDANSPFRDLQISTTNEVLNSLGAYEIPTLMVLNKCDLVKNYITINNYPNSIQISAKLKEGLRELVSKIDETLFDEIYLDTFLIPFDKGNYISLIQETSEVISTEYLNEGTLIKAKVSKQIHNMLKEYMIEK